MRRNNIIWPRHGDGLKRILFSINVPQPILMLGFHRFKSEQRRLEESFPKFVYADVKRLRIGKSSLECAVCLSEFEEDETLRLLPKCHHVFHPECIDLWLSGRTTCPVCRANLARKPSEKGSGSVHVVGLDSELERSNRGNRPDNEPYEVSSSVNEEPTRATESPIGLTSDYQTRQPKSRSNGFRFLNRFSRSHTKGHSLVQPDPNFDRFRLILSEEDKTQLVNFNLNRSKSCGPLGCRTRSVKETDHKLLNQPSDRQIPPNSSITQISGSVQLIELDRNKGAMEATDKSNKEERSFVRLLKSTKPDRS